MRRKKNGEVPLRLARAAARFEDWRRTQVPHSRIPHLLWAAAVKLAIDHGISRTATALRLNYYDLKKHVETKRPPATPASLAEHSSAFVEVPASVFPTSGESLIEFENAAGSKMRVQLKGSPGPDVVALANAFWSRPR